MAVTLRLSRVGRKHVPIFRIVAMDSRKKRDGANLADLGTYDALKTKIITFNEEAINDWIAKGAVVSDAVKRIIKMHKEAQKPAPAKTKKAVPKPKTEKKETTEASSETAQAEAEQK